MKPGDHPEFFRLPPPAGRSRESTIVLDRYGRWFHDGDPVEHRGMARGFSSWVARHPDDGRFIVTNGYDWCYITVEATAYFVTALAVSGDHVTVELSDGSTEPLEPATLSIDEDDVLRAKVKDGSFDARFNRAAQLQVAPLLDDQEPLALLIGGRRFPIATS
jgi:hypothetical protein